MAYFGLQLPSSVNVLHICWKEECVFFHTSCHCPIIASMHLVSQPSAHTHTHLVLGSYKPRDELMVVVKELFCLAKGSA